MLCLAWSQFHIKHLLLETSRCTGTALLAASPAMSWPPQSLAGAVDVWSSGEMSPPLPSLPTFSSSLVSAECPPTGSSGAGASGISSSSQDFPSAGRSTHSSCRSNHPGSMSLEKLRVSGPSPGNNRAGSVMKGARGLRGLRPLWLGLASPGETWAWLACPGQQVV